MTWELLSIFGTIAFAVSGAIIAMEEDYDILGILVLALATSFGGGMVRNLLIGIPIENIWDQGLLFKLAIIAVIIVFILPQHWIFYWEKPGLFFDAIGLSAFAVQGALAAVEAGYSPIAVVVAATLTGCGGGIIRDILAGRKPLVFRTDIYAIWATLGGTVIALGWLNIEWEKYVLTALLVILRLLSVRFKWHLPKRATLHPTMKS
ncbi:putative membrane protein YeiH [Scopulibacillus darangshiensis]|uniref:Putative membrane protein YeiH n=1 Tax=Scopulibacillus darangshiensis TaxID=442528 RepID=A0A4R2P0A1_9BACL|nr:trimeric intracellular cation channel family protein [Scopulibacillus darangshiensis]TCP27045.1 putative membrane protein YeiH [Scopulibacillus darangshiensis]